MGNRKAKRKRYLETKMERMGTKLVKTWAELKEFEDSSETHIMKIDVESCNGSIEPRAGLKSIHDYKYLSTHTFYGGTHKYSTKLLQECGFNVIIANWDELGW